MGQGRVLTALHCVRSPDGRARKHLQVYLRDDLAKKNGRFFRATVIWPERLYLPSPDVAVLQIGGDDAPTAVADHRFSELPRVPILGSARGFPAFAKGEELPGGRLEREQPGRVHFTSLTRRELTIDATGHPSISTKDWAGLSGGPLLANELIVGVMREVPDKWPDGAIIAEPLAPLLRGTLGARLRELLGITRALEDPTDPFQLTLFKSYEYIGSESFQASQRIFDLAQSQAFHGRSKDAEAVEQGLMAGRGVTLLYGEAGLGKSRLVASLAHRLSRSHSRTVLTHAFSVRDTRSATRDAMVANLVRQAADLLGPAALGEGAPNDALLSDRLARLLQSDQADNQALIVIIDGLDEAAELIAPWAFRLGKGVFVLATCRVASGEKPRVLAQWRDRAVEAEQLLLEHALEPLDEEDVAHWISGTIGRAVGSSDPIVSDIMEVGEGIWLFIKFILDDETAGLVIEKKNGFLDYATQRLQELSDALALTNSRWSWGEIKKLFTLLVAAKIPLPEAALGDLVSPHLLDELDPRARRWLLRQDDHVSFAHPRFATIFGAALPKLKPDLAGIVQRSLEEVCTEAWRAWQRDDRTPRAILPYALAWLPTHLIESGLFEAAASLLSDGRFVQARLERSPTRATVHRSATETIRVSFHVVDDHPIAYWRLFWTEVEGRVARAIERATSLASDPVQLFVQLALDRLGPEAPAAAGLRAKAMAPRLMEACGFQHPNLLRSLDDLHDPGTSVITGVLEFSDMFVSWGEDGAIRFLSRDGEPRPSAECRAHDGKISGVLVLTDSLVSWGSDGFVRFWDREGRLRSRGTEIAHAGGVKGVQVVDRGLVSWGGDGTVRCWSLDGQYRNDWPRVDETRAFKGAFAAGDTLATWDERSIEFVDLDGKLLQRLDWDRWWHGVDEMIQVDDRLIGWGLYALRIWTVQGELLAGGPVDERIQGLLPLDHGLVTWNSEGSIMFWTKDGKRRNGGSNTAHKSSVDRVVRLADGLVSWGSDGAIYFWTHEGDLRPGGGRDAHVSGVYGMLVDGDQLISWGGRGIRF